MPTRRARLPGRQTQVLTGETELEAYKAGLTDKQAGRQVTATIPGR